MTIEEVFTSVVEDTGVSRSLLRGKSRVERVCAGRVLVVIRALQAGHGPQDAPKDAAEKALDDIAALCGCPEWEYPGQVVRDVQAAVDAREALARIEYGNMGCGNRPCSIQAQEGQHTNGACHCLDELPPEKRIRVRLRIRDLEEQLAAAVAAKSREIALPTIHELFGRARLTQAMVAEATGVSQSNVSAWCSKHTRKPRASASARLADLLGLRVADVHAIFERDFKPPALRVKRAARQEHP